MNLSRRKKEARAELAKALGIKTEEVDKRGEELHETNPMMGHRGVRLGISYPDVTEMQIRAIFESAAELMKSGKHPKAELMVPVTCDVAELDVTKEIFDRVQAEAEKKFGTKIHCAYGTMIEIPRAALLADRMAKTAEFFSFGTNDLTQMGFGFSRDDIGSFLPEYLERRVLACDPFQTIDQDGIGQLILMSVERGRKQDPISRLVFVVNRGATRHRWSSATRRDLTMSVAHRSECRLRVWQQLTQP